MAVTTQINDYPAWYGGDSHRILGKSKVTVFGYPIPPNVQAVDHSFNITDDSVKIAWTTEKFAMTERKWHYMEMSMPVTEEKITALLIAMKLSC